MSPARQSARSRLFRVRETRQIEALTAPARQEIVDALALAGPCSIAELADSLGRAPDSLYYHIGKLEQVGLVVRRGSRGSGPSETALFDTPAARLAIDHEPKTPRQKNMLMKLVSACLRIGERDLRAALEAGIAVYRRGPKRNAFGARVKGWLTADELAQVNEHLEALSSIISHGAKRPDADLHAISFVLTPIQATQRQRT